MILQKAILMIYPNAQPLMDFNIEFDGERQFIRDWSYSEPQPTDEQLNQAWIDSLKEDKLSELSIACQSAIYAGFTATNGHSYQFEEKDQGNIGQQLTLLLLDPAITSVQWKTKDVGILVHTRDEFIALANDANNHKRSNMGKYWTLEAQLASATTEDAILAILW